MFEDAFSHFDALPRTISMVEIPETHDDSVKLMHMSGDTLYVAADETLFVYKVSNLGSPIAEYPLGGNSITSIISDNRLYLGGYFGYLVFE